MPEGSSIVGISSLGSTRVLTDYVLVGTSKAALESLVRYLAVELAPRGIRVNAVSGGVVDTEALEYFPQKEQMLEWGQQRTPAGRLVTAEDIANAVVFLCSPEAEMIRGHVLVVEVAPLSGRRSRQSGSTDARSSTSTSRGSRSGSRASSSIVSTTTASCGEPGPPTGSWSTRPNAT
jgi:hypothetical protein